jgi:hypothetical protein
VFVFIHRFGNPLEYRRLFSSHRDNYGLLHAIADFAAAEIPIANRQTDSESDMLRKHFRSKCRTRELNSIAELKVTDRYVAPISCENFMITGNSHFVARLCTQSVHLFAASRKNASNKVSVAIRSDNAGRFSNKLINPSPTIGRSD